MMHTITDDMLRCFRDQLKYEEHSAATIEKYSRDTKAFQRWLEDRPLNRQTVATWKKHLVEIGRAPSTVNGALSAVNGLLRCIGREDCRVRFLKIQRRIFREKGKNLTKEEYRRLVDTAYERGKARLGILLETLGATGIRVSEVQYISVETARAGCAEISMKGKIRTILMPRQLCRKLLKFARKQGIVSGAIFRTRSGKILSRRQIWSEMKSLCKHADVVASKVFPHNLRHMFATEYYRKYKDIMKLSDILGHSSIDITRIYLIDTGEEHQQQIENLKLVS